LVAPSAVEASNVMALCRRSYVRLLTAQQSLVAEHREQGQLAIEKQGQESIVCMETTSDCAREGRKMELMDARAPR
jgi:hypothetical protein